MTLSASSELAPADVDDPANSTRQDDAPPAPADAAVRRKRVWGCAILVTLALATPVLLLVAAYVALVWSGDRQAKEAISRARAAGDPVTLADMNEHYSSSPAIEEATAHWLRALQVVGDPAFDTTSTTLPVFDGGEIVGLSAISAEDLPEVQEFLAKFRQAIDEAHAARNAGSVARFPIDFADGIAMTIPHVQQLRSLVRLLELDLEAKLLADDVDGAVENLLSMIAVSESLSNEPLLISQLVRVATFAVAIETLERTLQRRDLTDEQLARIEEAIARQDFRASLQASLQGEQFFLIQTMHVDAETGSPEIDWARTLPLRGGDLAKGLELWRNVIDASEEGTLETLEASAAMENEVEAVAGSSIDRLRYPMTMMLLPAIDKAAGAFVRAEATARTARTAIACERFRLEQGAFPATLADLTPKYLPNVPLDPCDRQPLRYVVDDSGITIYSIGLNQRDDGGLDDPTSGDLTFALIDGRAKEDKAKKAVAEANTP